MDLKAELQLICQELTTQILAKQPKNIYRFCAEYLENKLRNRDGVRPDFVSQFVPEQPNDHKPKQKVKRKKKKKRKRNDVSCESTLDNLSDISDEESRNILGKFAETHVVQNHYDKNDEGPHVSKIGFKGTERQALRSRLSGISTGSTKSQSLVQHDEEASLVDEVGCSYTSYPLHTDVGLTSKQSDKTNKCSMTIEGHSDSVTQCKIIGDWIVSSSMDKTIIIWCLVSGRKLNRLLLCAKVYDFVHVVLSKGRVLLLAACGDGRIGACTLAKNSQKATLLNSVQLTGHLPNPIRTLQISPDSKHLVTGDCFYMNQIYHDGERGKCARGNIRTWDLGKVISSATNSENDFDDVAHLKLRTIRQVMASGTMLRNQTNYSRFTQRKLEKDCGVRALAFNPNSTLIIVGLGMPDDRDYLGSRLLAILCVESLTTLWLETKETYQIDTLSVLPSCGSRDTKNCFDILMSSQYCTEKITVTQKEDKVLSVQRCWEKECVSGNRASILSPDGLIAATANPCQISLYEAISGRLVSELQGHEDAIVRMTFTNDSNWICSASEDHTLKLWNIEDIISEIRF